MKKRTSMVIISSVLSLSTLSASTINGVWKREDSSRRGIQQLNISTQNQTFKLLRKCRWQDGLCSEGLHRYTKIQHGVFSTWLANRGYRVILAQAINKNRLKVILKYLPYSREGVRTHILYFKKSYNNTQVSAFFGKWIPAGYNNSSHIKEVRIFKKHNKISVQTKAYCHSGICKWESSNVKYRNSHLTLSWYQPGIERRANLRGIQRDSSGRFNKIKVVIKSYLDNGVQFNKTMYLIRKYNTNHQNNY